MQPAKANQLLHVSLDRHGFISIGFNGHSPTEQKLANSPSQRWAGHFHTLVAQLSTVFVDNPMTWFGVACELDRDWRNDIEGLGHCFPTISLTIATSSRAIPH
jgi:hypothetical protein